MENEKVVLKNTESPETPKLIIAICVINVLYLGYILFAYLALVPLIESKILVIFSIFMLMLGIVSSIGLLLMKKWALYAYTITCIINFYTFITYGNRNPLTIIMSVGALLIIWNYKDKILGTNPEDVEKQSEINLENQNVIVNDEQKYNRVLENTESFTNSPKQKEIKAESLTNKFKDWNQFKEWSNTNREKVIVSALCVWSFIHTYIILRNSTEYESVNYYGMKRIMINGSYYNPLESFYPFNDVPISIYDYTEYFVYVGGVWMIYFLYRYFKGNKVIG